MLKKFTFSIYTLRPQIKLHSDPIFSHAHHAWTAADKFILDKFPWFFGLGEQTIRDCAPGNGSVAAAGDRVGSIPFQRSAFRFCRVSVYVFLFSNHSYF